MALRTLTQVCWDRDAMALLSSSNDNHIKISLYVKWRVRQPRGGADTPLCAEPEPPAAAGRQQLAPGRGEEAILCCGPSAGRAGATRLTLAPRSAERHTVVGGRRRRDVHPYAAYCPAGVPPWPCQPRAGHGISWGLSRLALGRPAGQKMAAKCRSRQRARGTPGCAQITRQSPLQ